MHFIKNKSNGLNSICSLITFTFTPICAVENILLMSRKPGGQATQVGSCVFSPPAYMDAGPGAYACQDGSLCFLEIRNLKSRGPPTPGRVHG